MTQEGQVPVVVTVSVVWEMFVVIVGDSLGCIYGQPLPWTVKVIKSYDQVVGASYWTNVFTILVSHP